MCALCAAHPANFKQYSDYRDQIKLRNKPLHQ